MRRIPPNLDQIVQITFPTRIGPWGEETLYAFNTAPIGTGQTRTAYGWSDSQFNLARVPRIQPTEAYDACVVNLLSRMRDDVVFQRRDGRWSVAEYRSDGRRITIVESDDILSVLYGAYVGRPEHFGVPQ